MSPLVSIVIPNYNGAPFLRLAVASALAQSYHPLEVVVVDDGSTDDSVATIADLVDAGRVLLVRKENGGVAAARNTGVAHSAGDYLVFLDCDDELAPQMVERLVALVAPDDPAVFAYCDYVNVDVDGRELEDNRPLSAYRTRMEGDLLAQLLVGAFLLPVCVLISRRLLTAAGGFDSRFSAADDYYLWLRASCCGGVARYLSEPLARYRRRPGSQSEDRERMQQLERAVLSAVAAEYPERVAATVPDVLWEFRHAAALIWRDGVERLAEATRYTDELHHAIGRRTAVENEAARYSQSLVERAERAEAHAEQLAGALAAKEAALAAAEAFAGTLVERAERAEIYARSLEAARRAEEIDAR
jgi:glycosyltransferase involved in cell wall biosynthesis